MLTRNLLTVLGLSAVTVASAAAQPGRGAVVTYVAGQAAIGGRPISSRDAGASTVDVGQMLSTGSGSVQLQLTPGSVLRMDGGSSIKLVALDDRRTEVQVNSGRAEISLAGLRQGSELQVDSPGGVQTLLLQNGVYEFDANAGRLRVFDGKAAVSSLAGSNPWIDVKGGRELALNGAAAKPTEFDRRDGDGFASRGDEQIARNDGYGYGYGNGFAGGELGYAPYGYGSPYGYGEGFYDPFAFGFYPGFYGGYGFRSGYGGFGGRVFGRR